MITRRIHTALPAFVIGLTVFAARMHGQVLPWEVFADPDSPSVCDVINAATAELVVLRSTGELVIVSDIVSEVDQVIPGTFVNSDGDVFFGIFAAGFIAFADDGDGFRTLWWISATGRVFDVDPVTFLPIETSLFPDDFFDVPCDACEFWDDPTACVFDDDGDGIEDAADLCPHTPFGEPADAVGCSCSQLDLDADGIDDCVDLCPDTPFDQAVDVDGCLLVFVSPPAITVNFCGSFGATALALTFCGIIGLRRFG